MPGMRTYNDAALSGAPLCSGVTDPSDDNQYWWKVYPTAASAVGASGDPVQDGIAVLDDRTLSGTPVVFCASSFDALYYWKAWELTRPGLNPAPAGMERGADGKLSGTPRLMALQWGGSFYYFKVYPVYSGALLSGLTAMPVRVCNRCLALWIEDDRMYDNVDRCPHCGVYAGPPRHEGREDPLLGGWI